MIGKLADLIAELPVSAALKVRLSILQERAAVLEQSIETLEKENAEIKEERAKLIAENLRMKKLEDFVEHRGAFFKRGAGGIYHLSVYCPRCMASAGASSSGKPFFCIPCHWFSNFNVRDLAVVMSTLPE